MLPISRLHQEFRSLFWEIVEISSTLFRLMVPVLLLVRLLDELGVIHWLGELMGSAMALVGLPPMAGLVLASTMAINIYGGMILLLSLWPAEGLTVAQVTVLGGMMLMAHNLPVEVGIVRKAGVRLGVALLIRLGGCALYGLLLHHLYQAGNWLQQPAAPVWSPPAAELGFAGWLLNQVDSLGMVLLVITVLVSLLRLLRLLGIERLLILLLQPVLRLLGISPSATSITIIGVTLGLAFGGGLLIREANAGHVSGRDLFSAFALLALSHSVIEDTLLILALGADLSGALWLRLLFALAWVAFASRLYLRLGERFQRRWLVLPRVAVRSTSAA